LPNSRQPECEFCGKRFVVWTLVEGCCVDQRVQEEDDIED
jgi:hypothetical protein